MACKKAVKSGLLALIMSVCIIVYAMPLSVYAAEAVPFVKVYDATVLYPFDWESDGNYNMLIPPSGAVSGEQVFYMHIGQFDSRNQPLKLYLALQGSLTFANALNTTAGMANPWINSTVEMSVVYAGVEYPLSTNGTWVWTTASMYGYEGNLSIKFTAHYAITNPDKTNNLTCKMRLNVPVFNLQIHPDSSTPEYQIMDQQKKTNTWLSTINQTLISWFTAIKDALTGAVSDGLNNVNQSVIDQTQKQEQIAQEQEAAEEERQEEKRGWFNSIFSWLTDFFGNLGDTVLGWIVPSSEELTAFLNEVNTWFSDRLGFVWYPFSLAVDLVAALAGGTADTTFKVPALSLNLMGEQYQIWNPIDVDIDAFGIFQYVRYFTSALLCAGVAKLAYDKWDEWIGGHGVG